MDKGVDILRLQAWYKEGYAMKLPGFKSPKGVSNLIKRLAYYEYEADEFIKQEKKERCVNG